MPNGKYPSVGTKTLGILRNNPVAVELAAIICQDCQAEFHKRGKKIDRVEALSWKEWAEAKIVLCPHCRTKRLREEKADAIHKILFSKIPGDFLLSRPYFYPQTGVFEERAPNVRAFGHESDQFRRFL